MSAAEKRSLARRPFVAGLLGMAAFALTGISAWEASRLLVRRYPASPFDDLFALLPDRENAVRLGGAFLAGKHRTDARTAADRLRRTIGGQSLAAAIANDVVQNRLVEVQGWLLPDSLVDLCALAAMTNMS